MKPIVDEYFQGFASIHYRNQSSARSGLGSFLRFLKEQDCSDLAEVTPRTITNYIRWANATGLQNPNVSPIKTFFDWAIASGLRKQANPVIGLMHNPKRSKCTPRPYSNDEIQFAWALLDQRGNARTRFAFAIAEEAGLRVGEICRLRIQDIDPIAQRCFVRLPNKTNAERFSLFGNKAKSCFEVWMKERDPRCAHDALLHNTRLQPCTEQMLIAELNRTLCKTFRGRSLNETGFEKWNTHRLRHTMASNLVSGGAEMSTVMKLGGWKSYDAATGYAALNPLRARSGYDEAMRRFRERNTVTSRPKTLTPAELLALRANRSGNDEALADGVDEDTSSETSLIQAKKN